MGPVISIGAQSFEFLRENNCFFVDKTGFIKEWWENADAVTLITRPRRFGKTLNLNMTECFFSVGYRDRGGLFEGLSIWEDEKYRKLQGTYPVIFLSFASVKATQFEVARRSILQLLVDLYSKHIYVRDGNLLTDKDIAYFDSVQAGMADDVAAYSLMRLSDYMCRYYGKKVLILLDEYDTPLQEAYVHGYWDEMASFIRSLFNATFKSNPYMERGLMTGITRVSRESIFSDLNNLAIVTATSEKYRSQFGFTEDEVFAALKGRGMADQKDEVRQWYDGFTFGSQRNIYNPWSITNFLEQRQYRPYWANSSSNSLVSLLIREGSPEIKMIMEDLLSGGQLCTEMDEEIVFSQLPKRRDAIWGLLLASGYLKVDKMEFRDESKRYRYLLSLTNGEVRMMFESMVRDWFAGDDTPYNEFLKALLRGDLKAMNHYMNKVALTTFSSFDTGRKPSEDAEPERFYHGFVLGLMVELKGRYHITSNRESGLGRYDVMLEPYRKEDPAFVLEFKVHDPSGEASLTDTVREAQRQIEEKAYDTELVARGIPKGRIRHYGFAFEGKKVLIG